MLEFLMYFAPLGMFLAASDWCSHEEHMAKQELWDEPSLIDKENDDV